MPRIRKILLAFAIVFIAIQFIQPARNRSRQVLPTDFEKVFVVPVNVESILQNACYDCHSNNTNYPWYSYIQPVAWIQQSHINNGKSKLNFSDFGSYSARRQISKLNGIANQIKDDAMPISSYKLMHKSASLTQADKVLVMDWMNKTVDSLSVNN